VVHTRAPLLHCFHLARDLVLREQSRDHRGIQIQMIISS
jgi:hypothetical protein